MKITKQRLKEIIREEMSPAADRAAERRAALVSPSAGGLGWRNEDSINPEWDQADKILSDLVYLADALERSGDAEPAKLANAVVQKLRSAVDAMERRLNEKFADEEVEDEVSDEETLHLKGNPSQQEIDRLAYGARTGRWRDR
tara:strand:- start:1179 stop:1607 length:429 start_codon:yes stop_codon:yes gene_type:complete